MGFFIDGWPSFGESGCRRHKKLRVDVQTGTTSFSDSTYVLSFLCCAPSLNQAGPPRRKPVFVGWPSFGEAGCRRHKKLRVDVQTGTTSFSDSTYVLSFLCCAPSLNQAGPPRRKRVFVGWPSFGEAGCRRHKKLRVDLQTGTTSFFNSMFALSFLCCAPSLKQAGPPRVISELVQKHRFIVLSRSGPRNRFKCFLRQVPQLTRKT